MRAASPLRYPGGKWRFSHFVGRLITTNGLVGSKYVEPYAGGASLALSLLMGGSVSRILLNDLDPAIYSFWWAVLHRTESLIRLVGDAPLTVDEWQRQREIYARGVRMGRLALGFATFYLNRTNHSGILNGGLIGGRGQGGPWRMDARFNRTELQRRIKLISEYRHRIRIYHADALQFLRDQAFGLDTLVYLDPPYFKPGKALYMNSYGPTDHEEVRAFLEGLSCPWLVSYDDVKEIRLLYRGVPTRRIALLHTARSIRLGKEVLYFSRDLRIPRLLTLSAVGHTPIPLASRVAD